MFFSYSFNLLFFSFSNAEEQNWTHYGCKKINLNAAPFKGCWQSKDSEEPFKFYYAMCPK